ncbi:MAG: hypothetical protein ACXVPY_15820 [Bacteroidia bacterium]
MLRSFEEEASSAEEQLASNKMNGATEYSHDKGDNKISLVHFILELLNGLKKLKG